MKQFFGWLLVCVLLSTGCRKLINIPHPGHNNNDSDLVGFTQVNLVANNSEYGAKLVDSTLLNAWGLAWSPGGIAWVNAQAGHVSELYTAEGAIVRPPVAIPSPGDSVGGNPTGIVFNSTKGFKLTNGSPAAFIFVGVDGILSAWNGAAGGKAQKIANRSAHSAYTGLAIAAFGGTTFIYAADFRRGRIDVWDTAWTEMHFSFRDRDIPSGYAPFNIQAIGSWLYVTYAKVGADGESEAGAGKGFVDIFNTDGSFVDRFASRGNLNAPWGIAMAPAGFLHRSDVDSVQSAGDSATMGPVILVGNFGDGHINVYGQDGKRLGQLMASKHKPVWIDGLWAIGFAPATATAIDPMRLYFTAGPDDESDGLFGYLIKE